MKLLLNSTEIIIWTDKNILELATYKFHIYIFEYFTLIRKYVTNKTHIIINKCLIKRFIIVQLYSIQESIETEENISYQVIQIYYINYQQ